MPNDIELAKPKLLTGLVDLSHLTPESRDEVVKYALKKNIDLTAQVNDMQIRDYAAKKDIDNFKEELKVATTMSQGGNVAYVSKTINGVSGGQTHIKVTKTNVCFVATATYQDTNHPDVEYLRYFRDNYLKKVSAGRAFVKWYYKNGPALARLVERFPILRKPCRFALEHLVSYLRRNYQ